MDARNKRMTAPAVLRFPAKDVTAPLRMRRYRQNGKKLMATKPALRQP
jgi:hypothetical protein